MFILGDWGLVGVGGGWVGLGGGGGGGGGWVGLGWVGLGWWVGELATRETAPQEWISV